MRWATLTLLLVGCAPRSGADLYVSTGPRLDFGLVQFDQTASGSLAIYAGQGSWRVEGAHAEGASVHFAPFLPDEGLFDVTTQPELLTASAPLIVLVKLDPDAVAQETDLEATLELSLVDDAGAHRELALTFAAHVLPFTCVAPPPLDFGPVVVGEVTQRTIFIDNPRDVEDLVRISGLSSGAFHIPPAQRVVVAPRDELSATLTFTPHQSGRHIGGVAIQRSSVCPIVTLLLEGEGVDPVSARLSAPLAVQVGTAGDAVVTIDNLSTREVHVTALGASSPEFTAPPPPLVVPAASFDGGVRTPGQLEFPLVFAPSQPGRRTARLELQLDYPQQRTLSIGLEGTATP